MLETLLTSGFGYHDTESERYAAELEAAAREPTPPMLRVRLLHIANHTIGEHLSDWQRARRLAEGVLDGQAPGAEDAPAWARLATARFMAGDPVAATEAEIIYLKAVGERALEAYVDCKVTLATSLIGSKRVADGAAIYTQVLGLAGDGPSPVDRSIAVASSNLATELVEQPSRTPEEDALMARAAEAAQVFWRKAGTWVQDERAYYLKALVANALGRPDAALDHAGKGLELIASNGEEPVDVCFFQLTRANAYGKLGDLAAHTSSLKLADEMAGSWDKPGLKSWYAEERARITLL